MPKIASVKRSATVAWASSSEHSSLLAAGTVAGAISESFDASASLDIFSLDFSSDEIPLLGSVQTAERFHRLAWGTKGMEDGSLPYGILAGGAVDGSVKIYNPGVIIGRDCVLYPNVNFTGVLPAKRLVKNKTELAVTEKREADE